MKTICTFLILVVCCSTTIGMDKDLLKSFEDDLNRYADLLKTVDQPDSYKNLQSKDGRIKFSDFNKLEQNVYIMKSMLKFEDRLVDLQSSMIIFASKNKKFNNQIMIYVGRCVEIRTKLAKKHEAYVEDLIENSDLHTDVKQFELYLDRLKRYNDNHKIVIR